MRKKATKTNGTQARTSEPQQRLRLASLYRRNLYEFVVQQGMIALDAMFEQDLDQLCGPKHTRGGEHEALRWGSTDGRLVMGGRRIKTRRPRARKDGREVVLRTEEPTRVLSELTQKALAEGRELEALEVRRPSLEEVYLSLTDEEAGE